MSKRLTTVILFPFFIALSSCSSTLLLNERAVTETTQPTQVADPVSTDDEDIEWGSFSKDELFEAIIGELNAQRGQIAEASAQYLQLAIQTRDINIIRRASQFAARTNDLDAIEQLGDLWIEVQPKAIEPYLMLSYQYLESAQFGAAFDYMAKVVELGGDIDFATVSRRTRRLDNSQRSILIDKTAQLRQLHPEQISIHYALVQLLSQSEKASEALTEIRNLRSAHGTSARNAIIEAQLLLQLEESKKALRLLRNSLKKYPQDRDLRFSYASHLIQSEELDEAKEQFLILLDKDPRDYQTHYSLALLDLETEQMQEARGIFNRLLRVNYRPNDCHFYLGYIAETADDLDTAIKHYKLVQWGAPNFIAAQRQVTTFLVQMDRFDEAHQWLSSFGRRGPQLEIRLARVESEVLQSENHPEKALRVLTATINKYPDSAEALFSRAVLADSQRDLPLMEQDLRKVIALQPDNAQALNFLGYVLADRTDRYEEAFELIQRAITLEPDDPAILDSLAWVQYKLGQHTKALVNLQRAIELFPDHEVAAHLGEVLWVMGDRRQARKVWNEFLKQNPESDLLKNVMRKFQPKT